MKFKFTPFPTFLRYTNNVKLAGQVRLIVAEIKPEYKDDIGLHHHEYIHVTQFWTMFLSLVTVFTTILFLTEQTQYLGLNGIFLAAHGLLYRFNKSYRLRCEIKAYKEQLKYSPNSQELFAKYISEDYDLDISQTDALKLLQK